MEPVDPLDLLTLDRDALLTRLDTGESGLTDAQAEEGLRRHGPNELELHRRKNYLRAYLAQYVQFFALLLEVAAILSFVANRYDPGQGYDLLGYAIIGAVVVNATFTFWQEYRADRTVEALMRLVPTEARVRRNGAIRKIHPRFLVPGDILVIEEGDRIAADAVLLEANTLRMDTSTLTGESVPVERRAGPRESGRVLDAENVVLTGTTVVGGNGLAAAYATGRSTEFGRIARLTREVKKRLTPMQREVIRITRIMTLAALLAGLVFLLLGYLSGKGILVAAIFALSLIVANVPEGMLPTITLSLSLASQEMARRNALIKNLDSVQTLGSATVICTDKTGTLTRNEMTLRKLYLTSGEAIDVTGIGYIQDGEFMLQNASESSYDRLIFLLTVGMLNCRARIDGDAVYGDPTELAICVAARKGRFPVPDYTRRGEIPFSSDRRMMSTLVEKDGKEYTFAKGAPEVILNRSGFAIGADGTARVLDDALRDDVVARAERYERDAYRVLAIAYREGAGESDLVLLGLVALWDPPREEVPEAIARCRKAGIRVMVITGDNALTARAIAREIGLPVDMVLSGDEITRLSDPELAALLRDHDILFARTRSDQKLRIASLLQEHGEIVAMTGDGVNDAPALRKADIGIAMGKRGTEVAKEAADMILLDDNFSSIVAAIEEGRTVYFNIKKFVTYILSSNVPEIVPYVLQFFLRIPLPLSVIQILSIDLGSDMLPGLALGSEKPEADIMDRPPVGRDERILDREVFKRGYFFLGIIEATAAMFCFLGFLFLSGWTYGDLSITGTTLHYQAMTMTLLGAISCQLLNAWTLRSWEGSAFSQGLLQNRLLVGAIILEIVWIYLLLTVEPIQAIFNTASVPVWALWLLVPFPLVLFASHELYKSRLRRRAGRRGTGSLPG